MADKIIFQHLSIPEENNGSAGSSRRNSVKAEGVAPPEKSNSKGRVNSPGEPYIHS